MIDEFEFNDGGVMDKTKIKTSRYQIIPAALLARYERPVLRLRWERSKMKNPVYYRELKDGSYAGIRRVVTEYLPPGAARWQLDPFPHDESETQKLSKPPMGCATLGREKIISGEQRRVTHPRSKSHNEPEPHPEIERFSEKDTVDLPAPEREGLTD